MPTPNSHEEQAVRVSPVSQGGRGGTGRIRNSYVQAGAFRRRMPQPTLTPLVLHGYLELALEPSICWTSCQKASCAGGAFCFWSGIRV